MHRISSSQESLKDAHMDRMTSLRVFREVVEAGSFVAAAERLNMSPPMASKHVAQLEKSLGARLLHRSSRHRPDARHATRPAQGERARVVRHAAFRAGAGRLPREVPGGAGRHAPGKPQGRSCGRRLRPGLACHAGALARLDRQAAVPRALLPGRHAGLPEAHGRRTRSAGRPREAGRLGLDAPPNAPFRGKVMQARLQS